MNINSKAVKVTKNIGNERSDITLEGGNRGYKFDKIFGGKSV